MPVTKRKGLLARRRRHDDEGEEEGSVLGDIADYASTAGSLSTYAEEDGDRSHVSVDEDLAKSTPSPELIRPDPVSKSAQAFRTTADTEAMKNGLKLHGIDRTEVLDFDDANAVRSVRSTSSKRPQPTRTKSQPTDSVKPRNNSHFQPHAQPANRNRYFLHDDRHRQTHLATAQARGRGLGAPTSRGGFGQPVHDTAKQWTHDLHETVNQLPQPAPHPQPSVVSQPVSTHVPVYPKQSRHRAHGPNRSFSTTTVLGNVPVTISLPGHAKQTKVMVKRHYTLLPQHRPPLRRDKPVRVSIPDEHPRYVFPSTERSFIFIPRAMRPNQQQHRGRGRGSFHGSRRPSVFSYTPSVGMSRRPSAAASNAGSGIHTPTGLQHYQQGMLMQKPVVRLPGPPSSAFAPAMHQTEIFMGDNSAIIHSPSVTLPMHQPVPQKTVSVADIESPTKAPPQQSQQPFHQQMHNVPDALAMPHIPEGAIYAQPFHPFPAPFQPAYYGQHFQPGMSAHGEYRPEVDNAVISMQQAQPSATDHLQSQVPFTHETNGMVYYYNPSQPYMPPMMSVLQQQPSYYYPPVQNQMFYQ